MMCFNEAFGDHLQAFLVSSSEIEIKMYFIDPDREICYGPTVPE